MIFERLRFRKFPLRGPRVPESVKVDVAQSWSRSFLMTTSFHLIGDAFVDIFCYASSQETLSIGGDTQLDRPVQEFAGGTALNTSTHLCSLSANVTLHTSWNTNDRYGNFLQEHCDQNGIDTVVFNPTQEATGQCVVLVTRSDRTFWTHRGCINSYIPYPDEWKAMQETEDRVHLHIGGFYNLGALQNRSTELSSRLSALKEANPFIKLSMVLQYDATDRWDGGIDELATMLDYMFLNETETLGIAKRLRLANNTTHNSDEALLPEAIAIVQSAWCTRNPNLVLLITRGDKGATVVTTNHIQDYAAPSLDPSAVVDTTGAGDAFCAGFLYGLAKAEEEGLSELESAMQWALSVGTAAVTILGASKTIDSELIVSLKDSIST